MVFERLKKAFSDRAGEEATEDYLEIDLAQEKKDKKVIVRLFNLTHYDDTNQILNALREGYTIAVIDIKTLKQRDSIELKRAVSKIKKTIEALDGSIAGFGENVVIATPSFATVYKEVTAPKEDKKEPLW